MSNDSIREMRERNERLNAENRRLQERREDQAARDRAATQQRQQADRAQRETDRHNRLMEQGQRAALRGPRYAATSDRAQASRTRGRSGGKSLFVLILVALAIFGWPRVRPFIEQALIPAGDSPAVTATEAPAEEEGLVGLASEAAPVGPTTSAASSPPAKEYSPCSATVTDQCQQD